MSFERYKKLSRSVQTKAAGHEKTASPVDIAELLRQVSGAVASAGQAPPIPPSFGTGALGAAQRFNNIVESSGIDPQDLMNGLSLARDEGALRQRGFENQIRLLQMEQSQNQDQLRNALGLGKYQLDAAADTRNSEAHNWSRDRNLRDSERHQLEIRKLEDQLAPTTFFGGGSDFQSSLGSTLGGGLGELISSPLTGVARGVQAALTAPGTTYGYRLDKMLNSGMSGLMDRIRAPDIAAERFIETAAGNMADKATDLLADMSSKAVSSLTDTMVNSPARRAILDQLRKEDNIISQMGEQELMDAYHSITKFAPTLATDKNAVRSALRQAAQFEGGLDYMTIKGLAEAEAAVTKEKQKR